MECGVILAMGAIGGRGQVLWQRRGGKRWSGGWSACLSLRLQNGTVDRGHYAGSDKVLLPVPQEPVRWL